MPTELLACEHILRSVARAGALNGWFAEVISR
jgi:hypothetical protein